MLRFNQIEFQRKLILNRNYSKEVRKLQENVL